MEITDVSVKLIQPLRRGRVLCIATVTFDNSFVVRNIRLLEGPKGYFLAMPSQALSIKCRRCNRKNPIRSNYCNLCGSRLPEERLPIDPQTGKARTYQDVAHPIKTELREKMQASIVEEYKKAFQEFQAQKKEQQSFAGTKQPPEQKTTNIESQIGEPKRFTPGNP